PRPGTEINEPYAAGPASREPVDLRYGEVDEDLCLRSRHEDPRPDMEGQGAEVGPAGEVLQRDPTDALGEHSGIRRLEPGGEHAPDDHLPAHLGGLDPEDMGSELDRVDLG